ncbi:hypothetical protein [Sodalinema gerasimenkoae]|uniref:hypothetical protein n=1 Tax=Sodalinema gerasimenkoae TaxID=2862348 RepID=UPI001356F821|nr:hypothetical protein [Sodalinema gerasimenkoae]MCH8506601.1 hypothetical protein [Ectothiorhodospiraceae bacterium]
MINPIDNPRMKEVLEDSHSLNVYQRGKPIDLDDVRIITTARDAHQFYFQVPIDKCIWGYGWHYVKGENPLNNFFTCEESLDYFYTEYRPENCLEALTLAPQQQRWDSLETPWRVDIKPTPFTGENKLGPEHGRPHCGPVSLERLNLEKFRLREVIASIRNMGYMTSYYASPDQHIFGYFLVNDQDFRFLVVNGQHRAAALVELGSQTLPATFTSIVPRMPRLVSPWHLDFLTGVAYDVEQRSTAQQIFDSYFDASLRQQRKAALSEWLRLAQSESQPGIE